IEFMDNANGQWKPVRAWYGVLVENVVQGIARDLLAAAIGRAAARGWNVVHHAHDELVIEALTDTILAQDVLALLIEPPAWAAGLPLGGKVRSGPLYFEGPATAEPPGERTRPEEAKFSNDSDEAPDSPPADSPPWEGDSTFDNPSAPPPQSPPPQAPPPQAPASSGDGRGNGFDDSAASTVSSMICCPFHDDSTPSCALYSDGHYHCF